MEVKAFKLKNKKKIFIYLIFLFLIFMIIYNLSNRTLTISNNIKNISVNVNNDFIISNMGKNFKDYKNICGFDKKNNQTYEILEPNNVDNNFPTIKLYGKQNVNLCSVDDYQEEGYIALDDYDGDITANVITIKEKDRIIYKVTNSSGNSKSVERTFLNCDINAPKINLNGADILYWPLDYNYIEYGATAYDINGNLLDIKINGNVDTSKVGTYYVVYSALNSSGITSNITRTIKVYDPMDTQDMDGNTNGVIYLTFDDGPWLYTGQILDILNNYNIKATFFVTSLGDDSLIQREYNEGHTIGLHTSSHKWDIYQSEETYFEDLSIISDRVKRLTGYSSMLIRFPGGSGNTISRKYSNGIMATLTNEILQQGYHYFDWNVCVEDAGACTKVSDYSEKESCVINYFESQISKNKSNVVLLHDIKSYTANSLETMINYGLYNGYLFAKITMSTPQIHQKVNN